MDKSALSTIDIISTRVIQLLDDAKNQNCLNDQLMLIVADKITAHYQRAAITSLYAAEQMLVDKINQMEGAENGNSDHSDKLDPESDHPEGEHQPV